MAKPSPTPYSPPPAEVFIDPRFADAMAAQYAARSPEKGDLGFDDLTPIGEPDGKPYKLKE